MKCPRCGLIVSDQMPECQGCGFGIKDMDKRLRRVPQRSGFVNDFARLLPDSQKTQLETILKQFQQKTGGEMLIVTIPTTRPVKPSEYVFWLFNRWKVGGEKHLGLMLLLAQKERRIESEVGYSFEHIISDLESGEILDAHVTPLFTEGKFFEGLQKGAEELIAILENAFTKPANPSTEEESPGKEGKGETASSE